jgi:hypothetical protein
MTAEEIVASVEAKGVRIRLNPADGKLTATPLRKVPDDMREMLRKHRVEIIEFIEERDGGGIPLTIEDLPPPPPPKPSVAEQIIAIALEQFDIKIELDHPGPQGLIKVTTPWLEHPGILVNKNVPNGVNMPSEEYVNRQRSQIPMALAAQITNSKQELLAYLRAPFLPKLEPLEPDADPSKRSIWERMARPDNMIPGAQDNQDRIRQLLFGDQQKQNDQRSASAQARLDMALPAILAMNTTRGAKK